MTTTLFVPFRSYAESFWPRDLLDPPPLDALDGVWIEPVEMAYEPGLVIRTALLFETELAVAIPGLDAMKVVLAPSGANTAFAFEYAAEPVPTVRIVDIPIALRFDAALLKPARRVRAAEPDGPDTFEADTSVAFVDVPVARVTVSIDADGNVNVSGAASLSLPPTFIGDTGVVIEADGVGLFLDANHPPPGRPIGWRGIHLARAALYLPGELAGIVGNLELTDCYIGNGGFSGAFRTTWTPPLSAQIFGMDLALQSVELTFVQNALTATALAGRLTLPFFDAPVDVEIGLAGDGKLTARLASESGLYELRKSGLFTVQLESLGFAVDDGVFAATLSGALHPEIGGLDWPTFQVKELVIDSKGGVRLEGGWLDLPEQLTLSLYGFQLEITKLGFGKTDDGGNWIGFSGGLHLIDGLAAGASVEGLRIIWYPDGRTRLSLDGVGVELEIPDVLRFKGFVAYRELPGDVHRFDGRMKVELIALNLEVDALIVIGRNADRPFFAIYLGVELPAGIPLWATGLGLFGVAGLFALEMEPNKGDQEGWYDEPAPGWYKRPTEGVTDLIGKWDPVPGSLGLGGGVTIGTLADNGFTFSGKFILVIVFPGPVILLEGRANILSDRSSLTGADPLLRSLAVLDAGAGSFLFGLDARYRFGGGGELIDISGGAEVYFNLSDPSLWHIYLGRREPRERRIRAQVFQIFEANAYFMLDAQQLAFGAWIGYREDWRFGPLRAVLEAWMEGNVFVSLRPVHLHGDYWVHGKVEVSAFGIGVGLSVDVRLAADVFDPFHLLGEFSVGIYPPWPLPDLEVSIALEWGPDLDPPAIPEALQEVAIEHLKVSTKWPLAIDGDRAPADAPVVPLDCRPRITFARTVHDDADIGDNPQPPWQNAHPWGFERIGDPSANQGPVVVRYALAELALERWNGAAAVPWESVPDPLYGSWAAVPQIPSGLPVAGSDPQIAQTKLWLWSKSGFDDMRSSGRSWEEWFTDRFTGYPCVPAVPVREVCCDFEAVPAGTRVASPWSCEQEPGLTLSWIEPVRQTVTAPAQAANGLTHALCFPSSRQGASVGDPVVPNEVILELPEGVTRVRLVVRDQERVEAVGIDALGHTYPPVYGGRPDDPTLTIPASGFERIQLRGSSRMCLFRICIEFAAVPEVTAERDRMDQHQRASAVHWSQEDWVLEPDRDYRLRIRTSVTAQGVEELAGWEPSPNPIERTHYAYFRTEGPPGLANLALPSALPNADESTLRDSQGNHVQVDGTPASRPVLNSELNSLAPYVAQTVPPTVPAPGEKPPLPRPVYRAYDTGVEFNENYVDLLYRSRGRSLALYLYDNSNHPARDAEGRLVILPNRWGNTARLHLEESEETWVTMTNRRGCGFIDQDAIPRDVSLRTGVVLDADTVYEARLVPLLFEGPGPTLDGWERVDEGRNEGPSQWEVRQAAGAFVFQTSNIWGGSPSGLDPVKPGTLLLRPDDWTDYRFTVTLSTVDDDAIGVVFRYRDSSNYYRFSMDRERRYRRLVRVVRGIHTILAEDGFRCQTAVDYLVAVEAIGSSLRVFQDGGLVFAVTDDAIDSGRIGLYCWQSRGAAFAAMRVDDFREQAPIVYRYAFTTSRYANFNHHLHSFDDNRWLLSPAIADAVWNAATAQSGDPAAPPTDDELRAYDSLADALGRQPAERVDVTRIERGGAAAAFLVESPEPIDWKRTSLRIERTATTGRVATPPGTTKLTAVHRALAQPNDEWVELLLRDRLNPADLVIGQLEPPGVFEEGALDARLFADRFTRAGGLLFEETFGPNALDAYTIVDQGTNMRPSAWAVSGGHIVQTREVYGGSAVRTAIAAPGTIALTGSPEWENLTIRATLRSTDDDAIGIVFRYRDEQNYYRFSMCRSLRYRRLIRMAGGSAKVLWEDSTTFNLGQSYRLELHVWGDQIVGYLDDLPLFAQSDRSVRAGRVGLYSWRNTGAHFEAFAVESLEGEPILWQHALETLDGFEVVDEPGAIQGPSQWTPGSAVLTQTSNIHVVEVTPFRRGTYVLFGNPLWRDVEVSATLRGDDNDAIGVMFRCVDGSNYYRFSMDGQNGYRRLVSVVRGTVAVLWEDAVVYTQGRNYRVVVRAEGARLSVYLDGTRLCQVTDAAHASGRAGLYCAANNAAVFADLLVRDATRLVGGWTIRDEPAVTRRSSWRAEGGAMLQSANTTGGGTCAIAGDWRWKDYRLEARLRSDDPNAIGLVFRYRDEHNHYRFTMDAAGRTRRLVSVDGGITIPLQTDTVAFVEGQTMTVAIDAVGDRLQVRVNGTRIFDVRDTTHVAGRVGLYCAANPGARFEDVLVTKPPRDAYALLADRFLAGDLSGWTVVNEGTAGGPSVWAIDAGTVRQTGGLYTPPDDRNTVSKRGTNLVAGDPAWTDFVLTARLQPGSDDTLGLLFRYTDADNAYRFSMDGQRGYRRLVRIAGGVFTQLWEDTFAYTAGRAYEIAMAAVGGELRGYIDGVPMFVVRDTTLAAGRIGLYCWANQDARFSNVRVYPADCLRSDWLLQDSFVSEVPDRWTFVDQTQGALRPRWRFVPDELQQTADAFGGSAGAGSIEKPGTFAVAGDSSWADYRVSVRFLSTDDDGIGVMFRYVDADNYYRLSMDRALRYRRLVKFVAGRATELWADRTQYTVGRQYAVTIDAIGSQLAGYVDGIEVFRLQDGDLASGRIALYSWRNTGARFLEARVSPAEWRDYYRFGTERPLPAGTRVRVYSGAAADAHDVDPGLTRRFVAADGESGRIRFGAGPVTLRLADGHRRSFLTGYADQNVRVLRKRDGTGFFVVPAAPPFAAGEYRFTLTYRRDISAIDPTAPVLSEAGVTADEVAWIDVPWSDS